MNASPVDNLLSLPNLMSFLNILRQEQVNLPQIMIISEKLVDIFKNDLENMWIEAEAVDFRADRDIMLTLKKYVYTQLSGIKSLETEDKIITLGVQLIEKKLNNNFSVLVDYINENIQEINQYKKKALKKICLEISSPFIEELKEKIHKINVKRAEEKKRGQEEILFGKKRKKDSPSDPSILELIDELLERYQKNNLKS